MPARERAGDPGLSVRATTALTDLGAGPPVPAQGEGSKCVEEQRECPLRV